MIAITGATGQLGRLVLEELLQQPQAGTIVAAVRTPSKAKDLAERGILVREADYAKPQTLVSAFEGVTKVLLISSNELGQRVAQHKAVLDAAKKAGVPFVAYTSILHCDVSPLALAEEHLVTEQALQASGLAYSLLRNGWYHENQTATIGPSIEHGAFLGASGEGRLAAASRADYAAAAAVVLTGKGHSNTIYELAGDTSYTRAELAAEVSRQVGKQIAYQNLPESAYEKVLSGFLPPGLAHLLADSDAKAASGALDDTSHALSRLIGRPTTSLAEAVTAALKTPPQPH